MMRLSMQLYLTHGQLQRVDDNVCIDCHDVICQRCIRALDSDDPDNRHVDRLIGGHVDTEDVRSV